MNVRIVGVVVAIFAGIIGVIIGGIVEDIMWLAIEGTIPECENMQNDWKKACRNTNQSYYTGKIMFQTIGFFAPFITIIAFIEKLER